MAPFPRHVRTSEDKVGLSTFVLQKVIETVMDEMEPFIVPVTTFNGGLIGDHTQQKSSFTQGSHGSTCS